MRLVLDTNVVLSGLLWDGVPRRLIDAALTGSVAIVATIPLLDELRGVIERPKFARQLEARGLRVDDLLDGYFQLVSLVSPADLSFTIQRDPTDDIVLAAAVAGTADLIVSGDAHLLNLKQHQHVNIVTPAVAADVIRRRSR